MKNTHQGRRLAEIGLKGEGEIGTMEKLVALTIVLVIVAFAAVYAIAALKGSSKGKWPPGRHLICLENNSPSSGKIS
jgi:hypothetical protein